ncbi:BtrH N-terminal domain-containing protein [Streptomyces albidus (ex Kaewkla and Franco 2022)]|uniref:BtrH N-terminal domain-containing protein n=1 Tax=Streptomyces albidus (ex Kaewkla and Franco 2022) TaxID=722709 RepID=UPI0015EE88D3|nr:BtrH N-terminal domain-containing protein [Streptomyces albidus (ex Kaewkla and Franco 2022)]
MTEQRGLKRLVRQRMARTGESYTTARRHVLARSARADAPALPSGVLYEEFGTEQHHEASLIRHALGSTLDEALIAGLAGGIGFMYVVFEYENIPPLLTIVAQHHPEPWVPAALGRLNVPFDEQHSGKPRWERVRKALDEGRPVFCTVDKSRLPWHGMEPGFGQDAHTVLIAGYQGDTLYVDDESAAPHAMGTEEFGEAWSAHKKGRHQMIVPTGPPQGEPDVAGAIAATTAHLTGPVLGNSFDVNFGFSGMDKLAAQLRDTRTKTGWERRFGAPVPFFHGVRRLYECLEVEYTAPGATRPLYADFLDRTGHREAAALFRESGRGWGRLAALALETVSQLGEYTEICEERMRLIMSQGWAASDEIRELGKRAEALATEYDAPDASTRRQLFEEMAETVDSCAGLERRGVELLTES